MEGDAAVEAALPEHPAAVVVLLIVVVLSYRQIIKAYPSGGGDFEVVQKNLGEIPSVIVAAALLAAVTLDGLDADERRRVVSAAKYRVGQAARFIGQQAVQMHGGAGVSQDFPLARMWTHVRTLRLADGPDAVHRRVIAKAEMKRYTNEADAR